MTSRTSGTCEPERIERPMTCALRLARLRDDLGRGLADAVVDHLDADVAGAQRDLLGAVGMAVEAGLADDEARRLAELLGELGHHQADVRRRRRRVAVSGVDAGRGAVLAEHARAGSRPIRRW